MWRTTLITVSDFEFNIACVFYFATADGKESDQSFEYKNVIFMCGASADVKLAGRIGAGKLTYITML